MSSSKSEGPQHVAKSITSITEATNSITQTVNSNFDSVHSKFGRLEFDLRKSQEEVEQLMDSIIADLDILDDFMQGRFEHGMEEMQRMRGLEEVEDMEPMKYMEHMEDMQSMPAFRVEFQSAPDIDDRFGFEDDIHREHAEYLSNLDGEGQDDLEPTTDILTKARENLAKVENTTNKRFRSVLQQIETLENKARDDTRNQERKGSRIQRKLCQLQESMRARHKTSFQNGIL